MPKDLNPDERRPNTREIDETSTESSRPINGSDEPSAFRRTNDMRRVFICHPYRDNPKRNARRVVDIANELISMDSDIFPFIPHLAFLFLNPTLDSESEHARAIALYLSFEALRFCDELCIAHSRITDGMSQEIKEAERLNLAVWTFDSKVPE